MNAPMRIETYEFGRIRIRGKEYTGDVIVFPERVSPEWWRKEGHSLVLEDLEEVLQYRPDCLVVGRGASGVLRIPDRTRAAIQGRGIRLVDAVTDEAVKLFNRKIEAGEKAVGAFHLTC